MTALLIDLDGALGDTRPLWQDWLAGAARILPLEPDSLPTDRGAAAVALDEAGAGNWRTLLERFAEDRAPVYFRPDARASAALRRLEVDGVRLGAFTDAPEELARVALAQLGATRRITRMETGSDALERLRSALGHDAPIVRTLDELASYDLPAAPAP